MTKRDETSMNLRTRITNALETPYSEAEILAQQKDEKLLTQKFIAGLISKQEYWDELEILQNKFPAVIINMPEELKIAFEIIGISEEVEADLLEDLLTDYYRAKRHGIQARFIIQFYLANGRRAMFAGTQIYLYNTSLSEETTRKLLIN